MTPLASADAAVAIGIALLAAAWLVRRAVRAFAGRGAGCGCGPTPACGRAGPTVEDLRRAAARGAARVNHEGGHGAR
ncbi:MAG: hypothetical protein IT460_01005 [Planctomycetes bacterium]|nr:hypothetical protein [Planctomycetota bacterium]